MALKKRTPDYTPKSLHEALTWLLDLPLDAPAADIATALRDAADKSEEENAGKKPEADHPDSHSILVMAINSPSDGEADALRTLADAADKVAGDKEEMDMEMEMKAAGGVVHARERGWRSV